MAKIAKIRLSNHPADGGKAKISAMVTCTRPGLRSIAKTHADIAGNILNKSHAGFRHYIIEEHENYVYIFRNFRNAMINF